MAGLDDWIAAEARFAAHTMARAISATGLLMERTAFAQRIVPHPGSVLASPVIAHYDPDPDYFFHWFRDSAIVIDALRVAVGAGYAQTAGFQLFREFLTFSLSLQSIDGAAFLRQGDFRAAIAPEFRQYLRSDEELSAVTGQAVSADTRVNPDGTIDVLRWARPQADGPAMRSLALLRWSGTFHQLRADRSLQKPLNELLTADLAFTLGHLGRPCSDLWEERVGHHYYTQLLQAEALVRGAEWYESTGRRRQAQRARAAGEETLARLDALWNDALGGYRAGVTTGELDAPDRLDVGVVLGVLHADRAGGRHSVLDPRVQATLSALEELFQTRYLINRDLPRGAGAALGRYAGDRYYGGGAWYLATLAAAEFYFRLAVRIAGGASLMPVPENALFRQRLGVTESALDKGELARLVLARGNAAMQTVQRFTPPSGELSEQFDPRTGAQTSARHLSWSYAAFITAAAQRNQACRAIEALPPEAQRASTD